jgi:hypothetical protein
MMIGAAAGDQMRQQLLSGWRSRSHLHMPADFNLVDGVSPHSFCAYPIQLRATFARVSTASSRIRGDRRVYTIKAPESGYPYIFALCSL